MISVSRGGNSWRFYFISYHLPMAVDDHRHNKVAVAVATAILDMLSSLEEEINITPSLVHRC